jgi:GWxTD domain-containing protein
MVFAVAQPGVALGQADATDFEVEAISLKGQSGDVASRVDIYTRIPLTELDFEPSPEGFTATYRIGAEIVEVDGDGRRGNRVESPIWDRTVRVPSFADTRDSTRFDYTTRTLFLKSGRYVLDVTLSGEDVSSSFAKELLLTVKSFHSPVSVSDILLLEDYNTETGSLLPSVSSSVSSDRLGLSIMYEIYVNEPMPVRITREVFRTSDHLMGNVDAELIESPDVVFSEEESTTLRTRRSQHVATLPMSELRLGRYLVRATVQDERGTVLDVSEKVFSVDWTGLSEYILDIDDAIAQLQYIAKGSELRHIREPESRSERLSRFHEFWRKRDPSPGTRRNERMEEYYYRVFHANQRFGTLVDGWKTDRGQVVVLFGEPDHVDSHPYNFNVEPYEIWYYYGIGRRFVFVDRTGLDDYRLLVPIWDERTRLR